MIGDANQRAGKKVLIQLIEKDTQQIRQLIGEKILLMGSVPYLPSAVPGTSFGQ